MLKNLTHLALFFHSVVIILPNEQYTSIKIYGFLQPNFLLLKTIPVRAKRVGEFIKNGHKKIPPTPIGSGSGVTMSLCHSFFLGLCGQ